MISPLRIQNTRFSYNFTQLLRLAFHKEWMVKLMIIWVFILHLFKFIHVKLTYERRSFFTFEGLWNNPGAKKIKILNNETFSEFVPFNNVVCILVVHQIIQLLNKLCYVWVVIYIRFTHVVHSNFLFRTFLVYYARDNGFKVIILKWSLN